MVNGAEPLFLKMVVRSAVEWSRENWHEHWRDHHAKEVLENVSGLQGYRQFHANEEFSKKASEITGLKIYDYEGTAEGYYSSLEKFLETLPEQSVQLGSEMIQTLTLNSKNQIANLEAIEKSLLRPAKS